MTKIKHHLNDELLMGYAAGALPEAFNLVVASHVSLCDECRARLEAYDAVGGALLENTERVEMNSDAGDALALLDRVEAREKKAKKPAAVSKVFPQALVDYVGPDPEKVKWRKLGMGVKQAILKTSESASARLLYIPAGAEMPDHGHHGTELTLVLQGAFHDEEGTFARGDIEIATEVDQHKPVAAEGEPCICLAATDAPLQFDGFLQRIVQRWARI